mgnify:CR=1 FL=1
MKKELTIIIPFLNEGVEVERTVQSILEHTKECVDIILINDGSDDGIDYAAISTKYNTKYLYNKERQGVAKCRDIGVEASETEYFLLLDAHMRFYSNNWYSILLSNLEKESNTLFCCQSKNLYSRPLKTI